MPQKKQKTRHSSGNIFGPSAELPDDGELFTLRDILAAGERQVELKPNSGPVLVSAHLLPLIKQKWMKVNPELPIHNDETIKQRIERQMESAKLIKQKKASAYQKTIFFWIF